MNGLQILYLDRYYSIMEPIDMTKVPRPIAGGRKSKSKRKNRKSSRRRKSDRKTRSFRKVKCTMELY